ncbi:MAG: GNAT family N-acetyltransferase [Verrucomicrobiae bacterium]|nr:GNAT family N-acetyltransferase [Verrucomicrobiae bacterium]
MVADTKPDCVIRRAVGADADRVTECIEAAYRPYMVRMGGQVLPPMTVDYAKEIEESEVWIADLDGDLKGVMILSDGEGKLQIANVAVHPASQGKGVGKRLINFAVEEARSRRRDAVDLVTHPLLEENLSLYAHLGWSETRRDESHVYMTRDLI